MIQALLNLDFRTVFSTLIAVFLAMTVHEMAHGLVSYWLGDPTAKMSGRLSLNPFHHIDWYGLICLFLFGFGWAKPVPIDPRYYKDEKTGIIWTSFAGPVANFLLAFLAIGVYVMLLVWTPYFAFGGIGSFIVSTLATTAAISAGFGIFNLIPIPPLDGSKIFWSFLPDKQYYRLMANGQWLNLILVVLIVSGILTGPLSMMRSTMLGWFLDFWTMLIH